MSGEHDQKYFGYTTTGNTQLMQERQSLYYTRAHLPPEDQQAMGDPARYPDRSSQPMTQQPEGPTPSPDSGSYKEFGGLFEQIKPRVNALSSGTVMEVADGWWSVYTILDDLYTNIETSSNKLYTGNGEKGSGWQSPAADGFMSRGPGASLKSVSDWREAAENNWLGLLDIASAIDAAKSTIATEYPIYQENMKAAIHSLHTMNQHDGKIQIGDGGDGTKQVSIPGLSGNDYRPGDNSVTLFDNKGDPSIYAQGDSQEPPWMGSKRQEYLGDLDAIAYHYSAPARNAEHALGTALNDAWTKYLLVGSSTRYEGPMDSVADDPMAAAMRTGTPTIPGGTPPGVPGGVPGGMPRRTPTMNMALPQNAQDPQARLQQAATRRAEQLQENLNNRNVPQVPDQVQQQVPTGQNVPVAPTARTVPTAPVVNPALAATTPTVPATNLGSQNGAPPTLGRPATANPTAFSRPTGATKPTLGGATQPAGRPPMSPALGRGGKTLGQRNLPGGSRQTTNAGNTTGRPPMSPGLRPPGVNRRGLPGAPGNTNENGLGGVNRPSTAPVLNSSRAVKPPAPTNTELGGRPGSTRPGSTPGVLSNRTKPTSNTPDRPTTPPVTFNVGNEWTASTAETTAPILQTPIQHANTGSSLEEVPGSLRGSKRSAVGTALNRLSGRTDAETDPGTRRNNKSKADEKDYYQEYLDLRRDLYGEEVWTVETPGGSVIDGQADQPAQATRPGPALGTTS